MPNAGHTLKLSMFKYALAKHLELEDARVPKPNSLNEQLRAQEWRKEVTERGDRIMPTDQSEGSHSNVTIK